MKKDTAFINFINKLLAKAKIAKATRELLLTNEESYKMFLDAFTHISYDASSNYEILETIGDAYIGSVVVSYIRKKFPNIVNVGWFTRIKHWLVSKKQLGMLGDRLGFYPMIRIKDTEENGNLKSRMDAIYNLGEERFHDINYISLLEDVMEAFIGALVQGTNLIKPIGVGFANASSFLNVSLDEINIVLDPKIIWDAKGRLNDLYHHMGWTGIKVYNTTKNSKTGIFMSTVTGFPFGNKSASKENMAIIASAEGRSDIEAEQSAAEKALEILARKYKIELPIQDPETRTVGKNYNKKAR